MRKSYTCLPAAEELKEILLSQAALDIILNDEEKAWLRVTSFYKNHLNDVDMAKVDNGAGDHAYFLFSKCGSIIKGFDHESVLSPYADDTGEIAQGIYDSVPPELMKLLEDESIERDDVTFCIWRSPTDSLWRKGQVIIPENGDDGEGFLLGYIFENADLWLDWAKSYYGEQAAHIEVVWIQKVYERKITEEVIHMIDPGRDIKGVMKELKEIGYII
jgi:hypothetical protein